MRINRDHIYPLERYQLFHRQIDNGELYHGLTQALSVKLSRRNSLEAVDSERLLAPTDMRVFAHLSSQPCVYEIFKLSKMEHMKSN